jgi:hypothetical protein
MSGVAVGVVKFSLVLYGLRFSFVVLILRLSISVLFVSVFLVRS